MWDSPVEMCGLFCCVCFVSDSCLFCLWVLRVVGLQPAGLRVVGLRDAGLRAAGFRVVGLQEAGRVLARDLRRL